MTDEPRSFADRLKGLLPPGAPAHHNEDHEPTFPDYLISWRTLEPRQKALTGLIIAQILVSALALVLRNAPPSIKLASEGVVFGISTINYSLSIAALIVAVTLMAGGLVYAHWIGRWMFFLCLAGLYFLVICGLFTRSIEDKVGGLVLIFAIPFLLLSGAGMPAAYRRRYSPERQQPWIYRSTQAVWFILAGFFTLGFIAICLQPVQYARLLVVVRIPLPYLFLLAGTDWAEIDDSIVRSGYAWIAKGRNLNVLKAATAAVCVGTMVVMAGFCGLKVLNGLPIAAAIALALYGLLRGARFAERWPIGFPWALLVILVIVAAVALDIFGRTPRGALAIILLGVVACGGGLVWLRRRRPSSHAVPVLLFGVVQGAILLWLLALNREKIDSFAAMIFWVAAASLAGLGWLVLRRRDGEGLREPLRLLAVLNVSMLGLYGLFAGVYQFARTMGEQAAIVFGLVMFVGLMWDILVSGHTITNVDGGLYPRRSRLLLFFAYVTMVVATVEFFGSLKAVAADSEIEEAMKALGDPELFVQRGIAVFGPTTLMTLFLLRLGRWRAALAAPGGDHAQDGRPPMATGPGGERG